MAEKMKIESIDLWNDHKPSQGVDPFFVDYFDGEGFEYDEVVLAPKLIGHYEVSLDKNNPQSKLDASVCPNFNGGIIFLKHGKPIRLYLCQENEVVSKELGHVYGMKEIFAALESDEKVYKTGKSLFELLEENGIEVKVNANIKSRYVCEKGYASKNDAVLESAQNMDVLTSLTFLHNVNNWETANFYPNMTLDVGLIADNFEIDIHHEGYILGVKQNIEGLRAGQDGKKLYGIALQTKDTREFLKMTDHAKKFARSCALLPSKETKQVDLSKSLLDL